MRRLDRILELISACGYSFHDLSRVQRSGGAPRFNMPFEVGLAVATARWRPVNHQWFLFEATPFRVQRTLSDLGGTDPYIHGDVSTRLLVGSTDALVRATRQPSGTLFGARAFRDLVVVATDFARREVA
jgi:hypothetical protein